MFIVVQTYSLKVFLNVAKAFDTVCHQSLLNKLDTIRVKGLELQVVTNNLFKSYLSKVEDKLIWGIF